MGAHNKLIVYRLIIGMGGHLTKRKKPNLSWRTLREIIF